MSEYKKTLINIAGSLATLFTAALFWENVVLVIILMVAITIALLYVEKTRSAIIIYVIAFILGPLSEAWLIHAGAWQYTQPQLLGFPLWLPFIWGNASLLFNRLNIYIHYVSRK